MIIITKNGSNVAAYKFSDDSVITQSGTKTIVTGPYKCTISDLGSLNSTVHSNVSDVPADFKGGKYLFDGQAFTANPDYVAPEEAE